MLLGAIANAASSRNPLQTFVRDLLSGLEALGRGKQKPDIPPASETGVKFEISKEPVAAPVEKPSAYIRIPDYATKVEKPVPAPVAERAPAEIAAVDEDQLRAWAITVNDREKVSNMVASITSRIENNSQETDAERATKAERAAQEPTIQRTLDRV